MSVQDEWGCSHQRDDDLSEPLCRVVCAAIRHTELRTVIAGARHYDQIMRVVILRICGDTHTARDAGWYSCEQGFIDQKGEFLTREQAYVIAKAAGQLRSHRPEWGERLYSESLY